ncbi:fructokinase [Homoserinimonas aerilata]|uniref:Fructokinase n=1 Tax=Homoserinimonas aerilata TaxID=1162970 RepID=A0A542YA64_9MICO|nr:carbohydrate kinase [Homoserinimonas aerilata]TQL44923.1 fructokinase [Homoserinimonas aerilata]
MSAGAASILVIGESIMDVVRGQGDERRHPGGSPMNVAYGLARLGVTTRLLTRLGRDSDGRDILDHLEGAGVEVLPASLHEGATSTAEVSVGEDGSASYRFDIDWRLPAIDDLPVPAFIHVGSISTFLSPGADSLEAFLRAAAGRCVISYDPNIRPALIPDRPAALERFTRYARMCDVVKLSDEDAQWLYPGEGEFSVLDSILSLGPRLVAMTRGAGGVVLATAEGRVEAPARAVELVDSIGAGDSFMAALLAELVTRGAADVDLAQMGGIAHIATTAAALTCGRAGANPPDRAELDEALR